MYPQTHVSQLHSSTSNQSSLSSGLVGGRLRNWVEQEEVKASGLGKGIETDGTRREAQSVLNQRVVICDFTSDNDTQV